MRIADLREQLRRLGAGPRHQQHLMRVWAQRLPVVSSRRPADFLPATVRAGLAAWQQQLDGLVRLRSAHGSADGGERLLLELADGQTVESVLLPQGGVCVSSQIGCAVGCVFCKTGQSGLIRQVGSAEIAAQVVFARSRRPVDKVVFMGMGEPAHNLDNVMESIDWLGTSGGIGHKNLVFSTVGDTRVFERLPQGPVRPALALSLHSTKPELRARLLPRAPRIDLADLVEQGERYARTTGYPVQYQWALIEGVNDGDDEIDGIARLLSGRYAVMNFIPYNEVDGATFRRPSIERCVELTQGLMRRGVLAKLRRSAAQDVDGGCGQLRARSVADSVIPRSIITIGAA